MLLEIWNELEPLSDLLASAHPFPPLHRIVPATPPPQLPGTAGGWGDDDDGWEGAGSKRGGGGRGPDQLLSQPYDVTAQNAEHTDSGEEDPDFSEWARSVDALCNKLRDALYEENRE